MKSYAEEFLSKKLTSGAWMPACVSHVFTLNDK